MSQEQKPATRSGCEGCKHAPKWRTDFPIEWEGDHYVTRREMVKFLTLGSLLLTAANWITVFASRFFGTKRYSEKLVGRVADLDRTRSILFRYPTEKDPCIVIRTGEGRIVAFSQVCTHLSCAVVYKEVQQGLFCPCHNGSFNLAGVPTGGPPTRRLPRIMIEQRGQELYAKGVEI